MIIDQNENLTIITQENASVIELVKKIETLYPKFKNNNLIIHLNTIKPISLEEIIEFLRLSNQHRAAKHSFVIVNEGINTDKTPEEIVIVPTLQEAKDIIEMEEMERDLGF
ncbi:ribonuclease Z [Olleya marilimosa]|jgi:6-phosphofructokinase|uniref:ribonuclease Z n=1 Tax=Olleya marilimosa TaxID=272164 RepID=UPI000C158DCF|nr:ribonuclease Z [Gaetbulibacter sp. 5U11]|tara:strand:- start:6667 stop:6999 length:333 start_codon:yes stop_codon:yes gene_type:complete